MMVTLESLSFTNAFTYQRCDVPLADQGFVFLRGRNGAGKSSPWEVLQHLLYGTTSRGLKKNGIVSTTPRDDGYLGTLVLRNPRGRWMIRQARNHSTHGTTVQILRETDGTWGMSWPGGGCPKRADDAQKMASQLIGLEPNEFSGCLYLNQAGAHTLIEGTPAERMRYVSYLFGCDTYDDIIRVLRERLKGSEQESGAAEPLEQRLKVLEEQREALGNTQGLRWLTELLPRAVARIDQEIETQRTALDEANRTLVLLETRGDLEARIAEAREGLDADADSVEEWAPAVEARVQATTQRLQQLARRSELEGRLAQYPEEPPGPLEPLEQQLREHQSLMDQWARRHHLERLVGEFEDDASLDPRLATVTANINQATARLNEINVEVADLRARIETFASGMCPTCGQTMTTERLAHRLSQLEAEHTELTEQNTQRKAKQTLLRGLVDQAQRLRPVLIELQGLQGLRALGAEDQTRGPRLVAEITRQKELALNQRARQELTQQIATLAPGDVAKLTQQLEMFEGEVRRAREIRERSKRITLLEAQQRALPTVSITDVQERRNHATTLETEWRTARHTATERLYEANEKLNRATQLDEEIDTLTRELGDIVEVRLRVAALKAAITCAQRLKKRRLHEVIEGVRKVLPRYAGTMFAHEPNTMFVVDEGEEAIDLMCRRVVGQAPVLIPVKGMSGGEKQRLNVALTFTLHSLLEQHKKPDCLILDEVDRGLDEAGVESLMTLVNDVKGQYGTVIMTSHRAQITGAKFDAVWTVTKQNEVSELKC